MRDILITGGTGFIGKNLVEELKIRYPKSKIFYPSSEELDLTDSKKVNSFFKEIKKIAEISNIFHLAALYKAGGWPLEHPATQLYVNQSINTNLFEFAKRYFPNAKLVSSISYCVYPEHDNPHEESEVFGSEPEDYLFAYGFTKKGIVIANRAYREEFSMDCVSAVLPTVYGPGDSIKEDSHVMGALIGKFLKASKINLKSVEVWGDGNQMREFIYVKDVVDGLIFLANNKTKHDMYNLGMNEADSIKNITRILKDLTSFKGEIVYNLNKFTGTKVRVMDSSRIYNELDWSPKFNLRKGIKETINYYIEK